MEKEKEMKDMRPLITSNLQLVFKFKKKDEFNNYSKVNDFIRKTHFTLLDTKSGKLQKIYALYFYVENPEELKIEFSKYTDFNKEANKFLECIEIEDNLFLGTSAVYLNKNNIRDITEDQLEDILNSFLKSISSIDLEILFTNSILGSRDSLLDDKQLNQIRLHKRFSVFKKLIGKKGNIYNKEIKQLFIQIDGSDYILKKQLFYYILKKSSLQTFEDLEKNYETIKGIKPFTTQEKQFIYSGEIAEYVAKLEMLFKEYIHKENMIDQIKNKYEFNPDKIKLEIPLNINAYSLNSRYNQEVCNMFIYAFRNYTSLTLETFRRMLIYEVNRILKLDIKDILLTCFKYDKESENIEKLKEDRIYFDDLQFLLEERSPIQLKYDPEVKNISHVSKSYVIFRGFSQESKRIENINISWERTFYIKDKKGRDPIVCKIRRNKKHFRNLRLNMESEIEIQAIFNIEYQYLVKKAKWIIKDKFFEIIDIEVLDEFKSLEIEVGQHFNGVSMLENTRDGLILYKYPKNKKVYYNRILDVPIILLDTYKGANNIFYKCDIGGEIITKTKNDISDYLENETTLNYTTGNKLKEAISMILNAYIKENGINLKPMFNTIGIFENGKKEIIISHPDNEKIAVIGENDIQVDVIENVRNLGIDQKGSLTKHFHNLLHIDTLPLNIRLGVFGYAAISPFFYYLSKYLDVFPNLFIIGIAGSGKTTLLELLINDMYGTKMKSPDSIDSVARLTKYSTESTFPLNIDDIDILEEKLMNWIKTNSTRKGTRDRLTKNNKKISEQTYASYTGSANSKSFLAGARNDAFRKRCFIFELMEKIDLSKETTKFEKNKAIINDNEIYGFYFLEKAIEYIDNFYKTKKLNTYGKLVKMIKERKRKFKTYFIENNLRLSDIRRLTMYSLIHIGLELWNYAFNKNKLKSQILEKALDLKDNTFKCFISELEKAEFNISLEIIDNIVEFYLGRTGKFERKTPNDEIVIQRDFVNAYDEFARKRGYDTLKTLAKLGDIQSELLNTHIKPATHYFFKNDHYVTEWGVIFHIETIVNLRNNGNKEKNKMIIEEIKEEQEEIEEVDLNKVFASGMNDNIKKIELLLNKLKEILDDNNVDKVGKDSLIQVLELDMKKQDIERILKELIFDETLILKDGFIQFKNRKK